MLFRSAEEAEEKPQANADKVNGSEAPVIEMEQSTDDLIGREIIIDNNHRREGRGISGVPFVVREAKPPANKTDFRFAVYVIVKILKQDKLKATARLLEIMDTLREQCPWDRKQTFETLRNNTIEGTRLPLSAE